jgi:hypothetical protein
MSGSLPQVPNYLPNIQSPFQAAVQGLQVGQAFGEAASAEQQRASMQSAMQAFQRNPSPQTLTPLLTSLPPQTAEVLRKHWEGMETGQRESNIAFGGQAMSAILAGRPDLAGDLFMQRATAFENAGRADEAKFNRDMAELVKVNPQFALAFGASTLGTSEGGERMLKNILAATREPVAQRGAAADVQQKETEASTRGAQIAADLAAKRATTAATISQLQRDAQSNGVTIDSNSMGLLNTSVREATEASSDANRMGDVARRIEDGIRTQGAPAAARAAVERFLGSGEFVKLRTEYNNLRNNALIRQLGPMTGASSDKDVALFMSGFIDQNAAPETLASFLRGMEKVARADAATRQSRASWISNFGSLRDATRETSIGGFAVQPGTSFVDFEKNYSQSLLGFNRQGTAQEPSYMRFAPQAGR